MRIMHLLIRIVAIFYSEFALRPGISCSEKNFYSQITFKPDDVSKQIQQNGGFIPGIRAGKPTAEYLGKISSRLTLFGAIFLAFIALVPSLIFNALATTTLDSTLINAFSVTGLMIIVSVALELDKQLEAQMLMRNYRGFLK